MSDDKKDAARQARRLKADPAWNPAQGARGGEDPRQTLREIAQAERTAGVYEQPCEDCAREREKSADPGALCPTHLAAALGF